MRDGDRPRILFAAGGTGGHVYPAIAVADEIRRLNPLSAIVFAGTRDKMEWDAVPKAGYEISPITVAGFQRGRIVQNLGTPFKAIRGFLQSLSLVRAFDPDVAVGTGGYVAGPVLAAAAALKRRVVVQEQNAYAGVTNRLVGRWADEIHLAFPEAVKFFPKERCHMTGNPTRSELHGADRSEGRAFYDVPSEAQLVFVFGGSLGSEAFNRVLVDLAPAIARENRFLLWQTGPRYYDRVVQTIGNNERIRLRRYIDRMDLAYAASDLVVARAGASTCSELMMTGTPSILVPSPNVAEDHQTRNAESLVSANAAALLKESDMTNLLVETIDTLITDQDLLHTMGAAAAQLARPEAATEIAQAVLRLAGAFEANDLYAGAVHG
ncbi:MAG: undecaprenyldiphospho-muramoylpentapeptide beta-N-acetylglucosaminyltransferase [Rhodothermales bacterium]|nr:undecaprenyldiphospho-muramoylpentapeptide beta-N-acetylglucosaminyltransferase [Rhodothermales bacterium]